MIVARIYLIRHGETDENRQGIMQGQLDTQLNPAGVEQAQLTANALEAVPFERAYTSDLARAAKVSPARAIPGDGLPTSLHVDRPRRSS